MGIYILLGCLPFLGMMLVQFWNHPKHFFAFTFFLNYFIMGGLHYGLNLPMPITVFMEIVWLVLLVFLLAKREKYMDEDKLPTGIFILYGIWTLFLLLEVINDSCGLGIDLYLWYKDFRPYGFYPLLIMFIYSLIFNSKKDVKQYLVLWGVFIIIMAIKCYWQRTRGFDSYEMAWLMTGPYRTHLISSGTRYMSLFTDAGNMGCSTAVCTLIFGVLTLKTSWKQWKQRVFWGIVTFAAGYCMMLSGTRTAVAVGLCAVLTYVFLSRNWKMFFTSIIAFIALLGFLMFTNIGQGNQFIRRMRTTFNPDDASLNVRLENQKAIKSYMMEAPLGIGLGRDWTNMPSNNKFYLVGSTPADSSLVYFWMRTGIVGLILFCGVSIAILVGATFIVWFKIKDDELRTIMGAFTAASAAWLVAGYGNLVYFQFPNLMMVFGMETLVYLAPYLDRKITEEKEAEEAVKKIANEPTA